MLSHRVSGAVSRSNNSWNVMTIPNLQKHVLTATLVVATSVITWGCKSMPQITDKTSSTIHIVAGTYSQQDSEGIYRFSYDPDSGKRSTPQLLMHSDNPSYLAVSDNRLYVANEMDQGWLSTLSLDPVSGVAREVSRTATGVAAPCYVAIDPSGHYVATANYNGGNISVFRVDETGTPTADALVRPHKGSTGP